MKWRFILDPDAETNEWGVWCPELPGCVSAGMTEEEALSNTAVSAVLQYAKYSSSRCIY